MSEGPQKIKPYEHLSDPELDRLSGEAADLMLRILATDPRKVVQCMVEHGCPKRDALAMIRDEKMREGAFRFYFDVCDAKLGDREAKDRSEFVAEAWAKMRRGRKLAGAAESELR